MNINNPSFRNLPIPFKKIMRLTEKSLVTQALERTKGNCVQAARLLGISRSTLIKKIKEYATETGEDSDSQQLDI